MADQPEDDAPASSAKQEALIFAKIVRYLAEQSAPQDQDADGAPTDTPEPTGNPEAAQLFTEIAEAFEATQGFEYTPEQAAPLAGVFGTLAVGMRGMSDQARDSGHGNAAAKMEWAAGQARKFTARLEESHLKGEAGIVAFLNSDDGDGSQ